MYRKPKFLAILHEIRETMSREADYDVDLFAEMVRTGAQPEYGPERNIRGYKKRTPRAADADTEADDLTAQQRRRAAK
jgi:hypothetical protein